MPPAFPLTLTKSELEEYNQFWAGLSEEDRAELQNLIEKAHLQLVAAKHFPGYYPFHTFLLCLLIELHKERLRLKIELSRLHPDGDFPSL